MASVLFFSFSAGQQREMSVIEWFMHMIQLDELDSPLLLSI
jgi:hypothetical protein